MATDRRLEDLEEAAHSLRLAQARLEVVAKGAEERIAQIPKADLRPEIYRDRVQQIRQAAAQRAEEIRAGVAGVADRLKAARGHFTPERARLAARFHDDDAINSLASMSQLLRIQRASDARLLAWAETAREKASPALAQLVIEEAESRKLAPDLAEAIQKAIEAVPVAQVDRAASLLEESDRLLFETAEQARGVATGDRKFSVADLEKIAAEGGQEAYERARASMKRADEAAAPAPAPAPPSKPGGDT
jgi:hypothetical protein